MMILGRGFRLVLPLSLSVHASVYVGFETASGIKKCVCVKYLTL